MPVPQQICWIARRKEVAPRRETGSFRRAGPPAGQLARYGSLGRAGPLGQAQVKRETTLEQPAVRSNRDETRQQAIEGHPLAIPRQMRSHPDGSLPEPPFKGLAEGRDIPVPHAVVLVRIR
jgi:hypothetical protein